MKHRIKIFLYILLSLLLMVMIFCFSSQDAEQSRNLSDGLSAKLMEFLTQISPLAVRFLRNGENIRTLAHLIEYTCLGASYMLLLHELFMSRSASLKLCCIFAVGAGLAYALSDEVHQIFVPGRAFQISDIAVDLIGCIIGSAAAALIIKLIKKTGASFNEP